MDDCSKNVSDASGGKYGTEASSRLLDKMVRRARNRAKTAAMNIEDAMRDIAGEMRLEAETAADIAVRNTLLDVRARRNAKAFISQFNSLGEGVLALLEGTNRLVHGGRLSVDVQARALHGKFVGRLLAELERANLLDDFRRNDISRDVYTEMGELSKGEDGLPGSSGNPRAMEIAKIIEGITSEMVARQNRAGAFINKLPGYVVRQTHDMDQIRRAGGAGKNKEAQAEAFRVWSEFILPLLDQEKTFNGSDAKSFLKNVHEALYSGTHGKDTDEFSNFNPSLREDLALKVSPRRILHFKDADAAWQYNQRFGIKELKDQVLSDIFYRARSIALMETLGPSGEKNFARLRRELLEIARGREDAGRQTDSLQSWKIAAAFDVVSGRVDNPVNIGLSKVAANTRALVTLSRMGGVVLSAIPDKVFLSHELAYQGISWLNRWATQFRALGRMSAAQRTQAHLTGVAIDSLLGNIASRYTIHDRISGGLHKAQQLFFDLNFMNWWTDTHKAAVAETMSAHLGEHASLPFDKLPTDLSRVLRLYEIEGPQWDAIRKTVWSPEGSSTKLITPDKLRDIDAAPLLGDLTDTPANRQRVIDHVDTALRAYISDRVEYAVPSPGAREKRYTTLGTRAGTPLGEAVRMVMMFKAFPITIMTKILDRNIKGTGSGSVGDWLLNNHRGKFNLAMTIAATIVAGYMSGALRDVLKGKEPKSLLDDDGQIRLKTLTDAAARGGGMGILGDYLFGEYDRTYKSAVSSLAGPVISQVDPMMEIFTLAKQGEGARATSRAGKFLRDNTPFINLFYVRPVMDYFIFWNMQEMLDPGSLQRTEEYIKRTHGQDYFLRPSEHVN